MQQFDLWNNADNEIKIDYYPSTFPASRAAVLILPGGAYGGHADYEGKGYASIINTFGMSAFVLKYRVSPNRFPLPLLDARRAVRFVRANAEKFGIDKDKVLVMGSSAGGHLAALLSTFTHPIDGEGEDSIDDEDFFPNAQILCYPVISSDETISHIDSFRNLLGNKYDEKEKFSADKLVTPKTPKAFIWHTSSDKSVSVMNSYRYAEALASNDVPCEMHIFPIGKHGLGFAAQLPYVSAWLEMLRKWLILNQFI